MDQCEQLKRSLRRGSTSCRSVKSPRWWRLVFGHMKVFVAIYRKYLDKRGVRFGPKKNVHVMSEHLSLSDVVIVRPLTSRYRMHPAYTRFNRRKL